jgi:transposase
MTKHLAEISRHVAEDAHAVVVLDGTGWHGSDDLVVPENTTLIELPPYSPELNPAENIWEYLRKNKAQFAFRRCITRPWQPRCIAVGLDWR